MKTGTPVYAAASAKKKGRESGVAGERDEGWEDAWEEEMGGGG